MPDYTIRSLAAAFATTAMLMLLATIEVSVLSFVFSAIPMIYFAFSAPFAALALAINFTCLMLIGISNPLCLFFLSAIAVPTLFFTAHMKRGHTVGYMLCDIALYTAILIGAIQWMLLDQGGIPAIIAQAFSAKDLAMIDPELAKQIIWLSGNGSFLLVSAASWWGILLFYAAAWVACSIREWRMKDDARRFVKLQAFQPPAALLYGLILCAIISLLPDADSRFLSTCGFVIILLPYCFSGAMYTPLRGWRGMQTGWMFPVFILFMALAWPAAILCAIGVWKHAEALLRRKN